MGRQLQIATTRQDEIALLHFISTLSAIRVFQSQASTVEDLWIEKWDVADIPGWKLSIWPQSFHWTPEYKQCGGPKCAPESVGKYYISNWNIAPLLELSRSDIPRQRFGRIYWGKDFSAPDGLNYNVTAFTKFVDVIFRWIRKVGKRIQREEPYGPYYLPDAFNKYVDKRSFRNDA